MGQPEPEFRIRTSLGRVRGLGSARSGTEHFWQIRVSSVLLVPLTMAFVVLVISILGRSHAAAVQILASPIVIFLLLLFIGISLHHMWLGMREIILDYVHHSTLKLGLLIANASLCGALAVGCFLALFKIAFGL